MKKQLFNSVLLFSILSSVFLNADAQMSDYQKELKLFKQEKEFQLAFDKKAHEGLRGISADIYNFQQLPYSSRLLLPFDGIVVTEKTMPKLYSYVRTLCQENQLAMPAVWLPKDKGFYNAMAAKLFQSSGGIIIGQDLINDCSDEELEAIIAHEIGHIKHNHVNKILAVSVVSFVAAQYIVNNYYPKLPFYDPTPFQIKSILLHLGAYGTTILTHALLQGIIVGKRFEREADAFACQKAHKAAGLVSFFKRLEDKGHKVDEQFDLVRAQLDANKENLKSDYSSLNFRFNLAKAGRSFGKWFYYKTPFGQHPSNEERILSAQQYLV